MSNTQRRSKRNQIAAPTEEQQAGDPDDALPDLASSSSSVHGAEESPSGVAETPSAAQNEMLEHEPQPADAAATRLGKEVADMLSRGLDVAIFGIGEMLYMVKVAIRASAEHLVNINLVATEQYPAQAPTMILLVDQTQVAYTPPVLRQWTAERTLLELIEAVMYAYQQGALHEDQPPSALDMHQKTVGTPYAIANSLRERRERINGSKPLISTYGEIVERDGSASEPLIELASQMISTAMTHFYRDVVAQHMSSVIGEIEAKNQVVAHLQMQLEQLREEQTTSSATIDQLKKKVDRLTSVIAPNSFLEGVAELEEDKKCQLLIRQNLLRRRRALEIQESKGAAGPEVTLEIEDIRQRILETDAKIKIIHTDIETLRLNGGSVV